MPRPPDPLFVQRLLQRSRELTETRLQTGYQVQVDFKQKRLFAVGDRLYTRPERETFHQFQADLLLTLLSDAWARSEFEKPTDEQHPIIRWVTRTNEYLQTAQPTVKLGEIRGFHPSGDMQALMCLADDMYQLAHVFETPEKPILKRLRDPQFFQGARYEVFAASMLARCGYAIDFIDDKTKKTPDLCATHKKTAERLFAEAKSRHRPEDSGHCKEGRGTQALCADVDHLIRRAMEQNPGTCPFLIFVDVNLPFTGNTQVPWIQEISDYLNRQHQLNPERMSLLTGVVATNYSWHYEGTAPSSDPEATYYAHPSARFQLPPQFWETIGRALGEYGSIPDEEVRKQEIDERYPDLPPL